MSCLKHLPFLFSAAFLVLLLGLKAAWVRKCERRLLIGHYTLPPRKSDKLKQKEPTYGWTQSFFMKGFSISQLKNDHQSGWKQQGKPPPCQNLLSRIVSIPPKKEPFTIIRWCSCHLKLMTAFFFSSASLEAGDSSGRRWPVCWRIFGTLSDWHQTRARLPGQWR